MAFEMQESNPLGSDSKLRSDEPRELESIKVETDGFREEPEQFHLRHRFVVRSVTCSMGDLQCGRETNALIDMYDERTDCSWLIGPKMGSDIRKLYNALTDMNDGKDPQFRGVLRLKCAQCGHDHREQEKCEHGYEPENAIYFCQCSMPFSVGLCACWFCAA